MKMATDYTYTPIDYEALVQNVCAALASGDEVHLARNARRAAEMAAICQFVGSGPAAFLLYLLCERTCLRLAEPGIARGEYGVELANPATFAAGVSLDARTTEALNGEPALAVFEAADPAACAWELVRLLERAERCAVPGVLYLLAAVGCQQMTAAAVKQARSR
jgi:hypothetical protein